MHIHIVQQQYQAKLYNQFDISEIQVKMHLNLLSLFQNAALKIWIYNCLDLLGEIPPSFQNPV